MITAPRKTNQNQTKLSTLSKSLLKQNQFQNTQIISNIIREKSAENLKKVKFKDSSSIDSITVNNEARQSKQGRNDQEINKNSQFEQKYYQNQTNRYQTVNNEDQNLLSINDKRINKRIQGGVFRTNNLRQSKETENRQLNAGIMQQSHNQLMIASDFKLNDEADCFPQSTKNYQRTEASILNQFSKDNRHQHFQNNIKSLETLQINQSEIDLKQKQANQPNNTQDPQRFRRRLIALAQAQQDRLGIPQNFNNTLNINSQNTISARNIENINQKVRSEERTSNSIPQQIINQQTETLIGGIIHSQRAITNANFNVINQSSTTVKRKFQSIESKNELPHMTINNGNDQQTNGNWIGSGRITTKSQGVLVKPKEDQKIQSESNYQSLPLQANNIFDQQSPNKQTQGDYNITSSNINIGNKRIKLVVPVNKISNLNSLQQSSELNQGTNIANKIQSIGQPIIEMKISQTSYNNQNPSKQTAGIISLQQIKGVEKEVVLVSNQKNTQKIAPIRTNLMQTLTEPVSTGIKILQKTSARNRPIGIVQTGKKILALGQNYNTQQLSSQLREANQAIQLDERNNFNQASSGQKPQTLAFNNLNTLNKVGAGKSVEDGKHLPKNKAFQTPIINNEVQINQITPNVIYHPHPLNQNLKKIRLADSTERAKNAYQSSNQILVLESARPQSQKQYLINEEENVEVNKQTSKNNLRPLSKKLASGAINQIAVKLLVPNIGSRSSKQKMMNEELQLKKNEFFYATSGPGFSSKQEMSLESNKSQNQNHQDNHLIGTSRGIVSRPVSSLPLKVEAVNDNKLQKFQKPKFLKNGGPIINVAAPKAIGHFYDLNEEKQLKRSEQIPVVLQTENDNLNQTNLISEINLPQQEVIQKSNLDFITQEQLKIDSIATQEDKKIFSNLFPSNSHKILAAGGFGSIIRQDGSVFNDVAQGAGFSNISGIEHLVNEGSQLSQLESSEGANFLFYQNIQSSHLTNSSSASILQGHNKNQNKKPQNVQEDLTLRATKSMGEIHEKGNNTKQNNFIKKSTNTQVQEEGKFFNLQGIVENDELAQIQETYQEQRQQVQDKFAVTQTVSQGKLIKINKSRKMLETARKSRIQQLDGAPQTGSEGNLPTSQVDIANKLNQDGIALGVLNLVQINSNLGVQKKETSLTVPASTKSSIVKQNNFKQHLDKEQTSQSESKSQERVICIQSSQKGVISSQGLNKAHSEIILQGIENQKPIQRGQLFNKKFQSKEVLISSKPLISDKNQPQMIKKSQILAKEPEIQLLTDIKEEENETNLYNQESSNTIRQDNLFFDQNNDKKHQELLKQQLIFQEVINSSKNSEEKQTDNNIQVEANCENRLLQVQINDQNSPQKEENKIVDENYQEQSILNQIQQISVNQNVEIIPQETEDVQKIQNKPYEQRTTLDTNSNRKQTTDSYQRTNFNTSMQNIPRGLINTAFSLSSVASQEQVPALPTTPQNILRYYINELTEYEKAEVLDFELIYFLGKNKNDKVQGRQFSSVDEQKNKDLEENSQDIASKKSSKDQQVYNHGYDDEKGDYTVVMGDHIGYRYEIKEFLGKGSFGTALACLDHKEKREVAIKIVKNKKKYYYQASVELKILQYLREHDSEDIMNVIHIEDYVVFRKHLCMSFEKLSMNLFEFLKINDFNGFDHNLIRRFAIQLLYALKYLKQLEIIHCDLKPENILLKEENKSGIKIIDFGSSTFIDEKVYTYIQSRFYRAPEIMLGIPYTTAIDMWSFGCIMAELYIGYPLFPGESENDQMSRVIEMCDVPSDSVLAMSERKMKFFRLNELQRKLEPIMLKNSRGKYRKPNGKPLDYVIGDEDPDFNDFIIKCLEWNPEKRLTPDDALKHIWILKGLPPQVLIHHQKMHNITTPELPQSVKLARDEFIIEQQRELLKQETSRRTRDISQNPNGSRPKATLKTPRTGKKNKLIAKK